MPGKRKLAGHQQHHWRAIDWNIPSLARIPALPESVFPGNVKCIRAVPKCKITIAQEPMPRKSTTLDPRIDQPDCVSMPLNSEMNQHLKLSSVKSSRSQLSLGLNHPFQDPFLLLQRTNDEIALHSSRDFNRPATDAIGGPACHRFAFNITAGVSSRAAFQPRCGNDASDR